MFVVLAVAGAVTGACGGSGSTGSGRLQVVAGFYPLAEVATRVGGDRVEVTNLTPAGAEPHDLELTTRDVDRVEDADLVLYLGSGFQPAIERVVERSGNGLDLLSNELGLLEGEDAHGEEGEADAEEEHGDHEFDPHVWLDPAIMALIVEQVRASLATLDPAGASTFEANAAAYITELGQLDAEMERGLATCQRRTFVTAHSAFGYLAERYELTQEAIAGLSPEAEPDAARIAELAALVRTQGVTTVFTEALVSPRVSEALAREAGVRTAVLDPLEGLSDVQRARGGTYVSVMRENLAALRSALGCA